MPDPPPTDADRAAAGEIIGLLACHGQSSLGPSRAAVERYAAIIAEHMAPERKRVKDVVAAHHLFGLCGCRSALLDPVIQKLSPPSSETEEPKT